MEPESIELSFLSIFAMITFFIFLAINKYSYKFKKGILLDKDFSKPQAFHRYAVSRSGGIAAICGAVSAIDAKANPVDQAEKSPHPTPNPGMNIGNAMVKL